MTLGLSTIIALASYGYLLDLPPKLPIVAANGFVYPWLPIHAGGVATTLLIGAVQFSGAIRARKPRFHRITGRIYVLCCLLAAASGLFSALHGS